MSNRRITLTIIVCVLLTLSTVSFKKIEAAANILNLTVVHLNDFHARFEETNDAGSTCKDNKCIGGFSRVFSVINDILKANNNSILLNAGDNFQGTLWYNLFKWKVTDYFLNMLPFDAITLGNHEFDDGVLGVVPFIKNSTAPIVNANMDDSLEPDIQNTYSKSVVIERYGKRIGIIGVLLKNVDEISDVGNLKFFDESDSVNAEAERLATEENVFTNIVLSHSGYDVEQAMAKKATAASKISMIVGGHSHTFLYTGDPVPGPLNPAGPYPTVVQRLDGKDVLVVQASAYCRYLGRIVVSFDDNGNCVAWEGQPIFLATDTPKDTRINQQLLPWKIQVDAIGNKVVGESLVTLDQSMCRYSECLLGNFVTDAMVNGYTSLADNNSWTYAALAVINVGSLRTPIQSGEITYSDLKTAQPFDDIITVGEIQGKYIKEMFEFSMTSYSYRRANMEVNMLQISGFQVVCNLSQPIGSRVESIKVRCNECKIPVYEDLQSDETYRLIMPSFLSDGGDGFSVIADNLKNIKVGRVDSDIYLDYLREKSPILEEIGGRIKFV